jgi:TatD DNase family protein
MLTDAHCHPFDLAAPFPAAEDERWRLGVMCAASATTIEEFEYCEGLSRQAGAPLLPCFAVHPQMPMSNEKLAMRKGLDVLDAMAAEGRLKAVGETGFDLYNAAFRETEKIQDELFAAHLEAALRYDLPMVIHVRRAMHKVFAQAPALKKCRAVVFHSWPGTAGEGDALLRRGINAFFSFGTTIMLNHREAMRCCAAFPADRLLTETDAPYQPLRGKEFSTYADLEAIVKTMTALRGDGVTATEMESVVEGNFRAVFGG